MVPGSQASSSTCCLQKILQRNCSGTFQKNLRSAAGMEACRDQTGNSSEGQSSEQAHGPEELRAVASEQMTSGGLFNACSFVVPHTTVSFSLSQLCCEQTCNPVQISVDCRQMLQNCSCEWRKGAFQKHCTFWKVDSSLGLGPYLRLLGQNVQVKKIIFITSCH